MRNLRAFHPDAVDPLEARLALSGAAAGLTSEFARVDAREHAHTGDHHSGDDHHTGDRHDRGERTGDRHDKK